MTAATDAIGWYVFIGSLFLSSMQCREGHAPPLQGACVCPAVGTNRQCLPEIATAPLGPRNDKSGAFTIVTATGTSRSCGAGRGQPGPAHCCRLEQGGVKMEMAPELSLRGAKRRGNLAVHSWITGRPRRKRNCLPEIAPQGHFLALRAQGATAPLGPRNDKLVNLTPPNSRCKAYGLQGGH